MNSRRWSNLTKIIVLVTIAILAIVLLVTFREMIGPTIVAFLLAFILGYPVNWIQRSTGWARGNAVAVIYVVLFALLALAPALAIPRAGDLAQSLRITLEDLVASLQSVPGGSALVIGGLQISPAYVLQQTGNVLQNLLALATNNPISIARGVTTGLLTFVYVLVLNFWLLKDQQKFRRVIIEQIPIDYQEDSRRLGRELGQIWHQFLLGQLLLAIVVGIMTWIPLAIVGMPNAGGLALLAGVMEFLPTIGPVISGAIGTILALFQASSWMPVSNITFALIVLAIYFVITQIESVDLIPRLVGGRVRLHPAVTFIGIINGAVVFGVLGVLLATPAIASARTILAYIYRKLIDLEPFEPVASTQPGVRVRGLIAGHKIDAVVFDLDGTLAEVDWKAPGWASRHLSWLNPVLPAAKRSQITHRLMVIFEGFISFLFNQLHRVASDRNLNRALPLFNSLRGYPPPEDLLPQPGVKETLCHLSSAYQLALVSTRARGEVDLFLQRSGLEDGLFARIMTRDNVHNLMPHGEALLTITSELALEPSSMLMVSDTDVNLRSARAAQMASAGVLSGLGTELDLRDADLLLQDISELKEWL